MPTTNMCYEFVDVIFGYSDITQNFLLFLFIRYKGKDKLLKITPQMLKR